MWNSRAGMDRTMDRDTKNAAVAALAIMLFFGVTAFYLPTIMLALGKVSSILGGIVAVLFVAAFFMVFWLRARRRDGNGEN